MKEYTVKEAAEFIGIAPSTIRYHIGQKHIATTIRLMERTNRPTHYINENELMRFTGAYQNGLYGKPGWTRGKSRTP